MAKMRVVFNGPVVNNTVCLVTKIVVTRNRIKCYTTAEDGREILVRDSVLRNIPADGAIEILADDGGADDGE